MNNRVALFTGGGQGIGQGISEVLGGRGFRVAIADLNTETAQVTARSISAVGGTAIAVVRSFLDAAHRTAGLDPAQGLYPAERA